MRLALRRHRDRDALSAPSAGVRVVTEIRGQSRTADGTLVQFQYVQSQERWPPALPMLANSPKMGRTAWRYALVLLVVPAAVAVLIGVVTGGRANDPQIADRARGSGLRIMLDDTSSPSTAEPAASRQSPARAVRPAVAIATQARPSARPADTVAATLGPAILIPPSSDMHSAVDKALESGAVQPWREDNREGFVIAGPERVSDGQACREITILAKGDAQGAAASEMRCRPAPRP